jgi:hypothetical protein
MNSIFRVDDNFISIVLHAPGELASHHQYSLNKDRLRSIAGRPPAALAGAFVIPTLAIEGDSFKATGGLSIPWHRYDVMVPQPKSVRHSRRWASAVAQARPHWAPISETNLRECRCIIVELNVKQKAINTSIGGLAVAGKKGDPSTC